MYDNKNVYIDKSLIEPIALSFGETFNTVVSINKEKSNVWRIYLLKPEEKKGVVDIYLLKNGNITIHHNQGNAKLGEQFFIYLLENI